MRTIALAFSGGLDTSYCVPRLSEQGWTVHTVYVDTGGSTPGERAAIEPQALAVATESDMAALENVHRTLQQKDLLPDEHLLDAGYVDAESLISAKRDFGVSLCSPEREKVSWQAKTTRGFDPVNFQIDWGKQVVICPKGQTSAQWCERHSENRKPTIQVRYAPSVCLACAFQVQCTKAKSGARTITFLRREQHEALQQVRKEQNTKAFWEKYAQRCGIEGTFSQAVRGYELRFARYIGLAKTNLQMLATATVIPSREAAARRVPSGENATGPKLPGKRADSAQSSVRHIRAPPRPLVASNEPSGDTAMSPG